MLERGGASDTSAGAANAGRGYYCGVSLIEAAIFLNFSVSST